MSGSQLTRRTANCGYLACSGLDAAGTRARAVGAWVRWVGRCRHLGTAGWMAQAPGGMMGRMLRAPRALGPRLWALGCDGSDAAGTWGTVGRMPQALRSVVLDAGTCALEGEPRPLSRAPARKNAACLRFNSESGSSLKSRRPSTCGFINALCPDTEPARFKTQTCGFFWAAWVRREHKPRSKAKKSARCDGVSQSR